MSKILKEENCSETKLFSIPLRKNEDSEEDTNRKSEVLFFMK